jgi:hypothetical protein
MGCCGERRRAMASQYGEYVTMVYSGQGDMAITGGMTGKTYYFYGPGSIQKVDKRDLSNVEMIPGLKRVE